GVPWLSASDGNIGRRRHFTGVRANTLAECSTVSEKPDDLAGTIARNIRQLRDARGLTQAQIARIAKLPRATWANLEAGGANPTLSVLRRVTRALQVPVDELLATPRAACRLYPKDTLPVKQRGDVAIRSLLPDPTPGMLIDRMELPPRSQMVGVPHMPGTREYLACERGTIRLAAAGEQWLLSEGDVFL